MLSLGHAYEYTVGTFDNVGTFACQYLSPGHTVLATQANSSQVFKLVQVGYRLATHFARVGLLIKLKFSPNPSQVFHRLAA